MSAVGGKSGLGALAAATTGIDPKQIFTKSESAGNQCFGQALGMWGLLEFITLRLGRKC